VVLNKVDLACRIGLDEAMRLGSRYSAIEVSAKSGQGIETLRSRLAQAVGWGSAAEREQVFITNVRHRDLLLRAAAAMARAEEGCREGVADEYLLLDFHEAIARLGEITGAVGIDGIYERIFKNFCIGK
jgi:tRNA modification GTPase